MGQRLGRLLEGGMRAPAYLRLATGGLVGAAETYRRYARTASTSCRASAQAAARCGGRLDGGWSGRSVTVAFAWTHTSRVGMHQRARTRLAHSHVSTPNDVCLDGSG